MKITNEQFLSIGLILGLVTFASLKFNLLGYSSYPYFVLLVISFCITFFFVIRMKRISNKSFASKIIYIFGILFVGWIGFASLVFSLSWWSHRNYNRESTSVMMDSIGYNIGSFRTKCGRFPTTNEGLNTLVDSNLANFCPSYPKGGFVEGGIIPLDAWDYKLQYESDGKTYKLKSTFEEGYLLKTDTTETQFFEK